MNQTNAATDTDDNVQTMRDQGIADATAGLPAFAMLSEGELLVADPCGVHVPLSADGSPAYREAFAYARAYAANL